MKNTTGLRVRVIAILSTLSLAILFLAGLFPLVQAAVPWTKYTGEVSLKEGAVNELFVQNAWVIKDGGIYKMWYTHSRTDMDIGQLAGNITSILSSEIIEDLIDLNLDEFLNDMANIDATALWNFLTATTTVIGYATSTDGINWDIVDDQVLAGATGEWENFSTPCVIKNDTNDYEMWFTHTDTTLDETNLADYLDDLDNTNPVVDRRNAIISLANITSTAIGYAQSSDGIDWQTIPPQFNVFSGTGGGIWDRVATPCVIKNASDDYEMWYTYAQTDINEAYLDNILDPVNIGGFGADDLWNILNNINSTIGYATYDGIVWTDVDNSVLSGTSGELWDSVAAPCVIKNGSSYEMWYTHLTTDLGEDETNFSNLFVEIQSLNNEILALWDSLETGVGIGDLSQFLEDLISFLEGDPDAVPPVDPIIDPLLPYLDDTSTRIGYTTSDDGTTWGEQNPNALAGSSGYLWSSVAFPCVIWGNGVYEMWFTQGIEYLTAQNLLDVVQGDILPIGHANSGMSIELVSGWNFIGLPVSPIPLDTEDALSSIIGDVQTVWAYDAATTTWSYYTTIQGAPQGDLTQMAVGKGYWMELINPATLAVSGVEPSLPYDIDLVVGWNLISIPETPSSPAIEDVLSGIIANVQTVWAYDAATTTWSYFTTIQGAPQGELTEMTEGKAYWIEMTAPGTLTIN